MTILTLGDKKELVDKYILENNINLLDELLDKEINRINEGIYFNAKEIKDKTYITYMIEDKLSQTYIKGMIDASLENLSGHLEELLEDVIVGIEAIKYINDKLREGRIQGNGELSIQYQWGYDRECSINDWDYNNIKIKLSKESLNILIDLYQNDIDKITECIDEQEWDLNILKYLDNILGFSTNRLLELTNIADNLKEDLTNNMFNRNNIINLIRNNAKSIGKQRFKSTHLIDELGAYIAIVYWDVDFSKRTIDMQIQENRIIDLEDMQFIYDNALYKKLESRIILNKEELNRLIGDKEVRD